MANIPLEKRIWYCYPYMIPADMLSDEPTHQEDPSNLRAEASCDDTCYVRITRSFGDGTFLARVSASPEFKQIQGFTVVLTEAQVLKAKPWDCRVQAA
jgi:hypothetical protein